jgi:hypothetical protein
MGGLPPFSQNIPADRAQKTAHHDKQNTHLNRLFPKPLIPAIVINRDFAFKYVITWMYRDGVSCIELILTYGTGAPTMGELLK